MSGANSGASTRTPEAEDHCRSRSCSHSPSGKRRRLRSKSGSSSARRRERPNASHAAQAADQNARTSPQADASTVASSCDAAGEADAFLANIEKASLQESKTPDPGVSKEDGECKPHETGAVLQKGRSKPQETVEPTAMAEQAPAAERGSKLTAQEAGGSEAPRICREIDPEAIKTWLSPIVLEDDVRLAKLTEIICEALADRHGFSRSGLLAQLLPHTGGIGLEAMASLEDLLDWLEQERGQAGPPPADPRIGRGSEESRQVRKWAVGDSVVLKQLKSHPELNGKQATVVQVPELHEQVSSRCIVVLEEPLQDGRVQLSVKPENMRPSEHAGEASRKSQAGGSGTSHAPSEGRVPNDRSTPATSNPGSSAGVFGTNLEKLRAKADAEEREGLASRGRGGKGGHKGGYRGSGKSYGKGKRRFDDWDEEALREPIAFVPAEQQPVCSRAVVVVDPRGQGVGDGASDDEHDEGTPGHVVPPAPQQAQAHSPQLQPRASPAHSPRLQPRASPAAEAQPRACPAADAWHTAAPEGNRTLAVSTGAREDKRSQLDQSRREMIAKLTKQMQACLARIQKGDLDDRAKEKCQKMIATLRAQMDKFTKVSRGK